MKTKIEQHTWTVAAGRTIERDRLPFVNISRFNGGASPIEADALCHEIAKALNSHAALVAACKQLVSEMPERWRKYPHEFSGAEAANMARAALSLAGEGDV